MTRLHNDYYTYAFLREDKTPYYIGKGRGNRAYDKRKTIKPPKDKSRILFLKKNLTEAEAFKHEVYMIFVFGRKDLGTGILRNRTDGGEGSSGVVRSEETKKRMSEAQIGKPCTEETKKKLSAAKSGENNPQSGIPRTEAQKKTQSEKMSGEKHPNYGNTGALHPRSKAIIAIKPGGTELHFVSGREAAKELGINKGHLCTYLKTGHLLTRGPFKGWRFVYKNS